MKKKQKGVLFMKHRILYYGLTPWLLYETGQSRAVMKNNLMPIEK